jgi:Cd2+/Zn2+-exporting ATPase
MSTFELKIHGMDCAEEVEVLRREIGPMVGGPENLSFDLLRGKMSVRGSSSAAPADVIQAIRGTGMSAELWGATAGASGEVEKHSFTSKFGRMLMTVLSGALTFGGFAVTAATTGDLQSAFGSEGLGIAHDVPFAPKILYGIAIVTGAWYVAPKAVFSLRRLRPDMNLLMTIAVVGGVVINEWLEAALVSFLFALSLSLESWSVQRARRAVEAVLDLTPPTVRVLGGVQEAEVLAEDVAIGSLFIVKPGDRIPLDGKVVRGMSEVNEAPITGESVPAPKEPGAQIFAGTINGNGTLEVESTKQAGETTLANIIRLIGNAQARRAPSEQWVERFARYYTPIVFGVAILVFAIPPLLLGGDWQEWTYRALVLLVIGCPCALVISTPVSIVAALAAAARNGVLIKGAAFVEAPGNLKAVAMDKTGTLTEGEPRVTEVRVESGITERELLEIAAGIESQSDHPLARAVVEFCADKKIVPRQVANFTAIQGKGATCSIDGQNYWIGSHRFLEERQEETPAIHDVMEQLASRGQSVIVIGNEQRVIGMIALADALRAETRGAIEQLRNSGIEHIVMLTGDNRATAEAVGQKAGVDELHPELLPEDKVRMVETLVGRYNQVAMVGDGVNDAPAMARATLGIAMGAAGSDAAIETADIALMSDDLSKLPWLIQHSRRTVGIIRQNITLSLAVKALFVGLTFGGFASLWAAIAADMGVSLVVIFNALRLLRTRSGD